MSNTVVKVIAIIFLALFVGAALIAVGTFLQGM